MELISGNSVNVACRENPAETFQAGDHKQKPNLSHLMKLKEGRKPVFKCISRRLSPSPDRIKREGPRRTSFLEHRRLTVRETSVASAAAATVGDFDEGDGQGDFVWAVSWA